MLTQEEWRAIPGFDGYEVSDLGRVRSWRPWHGSVGPRILTPQEDRGYLGVTLVKPGERRRLTYKVHRLVMLAFVGPLPQGMQTRHLDDDGRNNALTNLAYGTPSENGYDRVRNGGHPYAARSHCGSGHPYGDSPRLARNGARVCRECDRAHSRAYRRRMREASVSLEAAS